MKRLNYIAIILLSALLVSCVSKPKRVAKKSFTEIKQKHSEAQSFVADANTEIKETRTHIDVARGNYGRAKMAHSYEGEAIKGAKVKVAELLKITPPELRAEVDAVDQKVSEIEVKHQTTEFEFKTVEAAQEAANASAARAEANATSAELRLTEVGSQLIQAEKNDSDKTEIANRNADIADAQTKRANKLSGIMALVIGIGAAGLTFTLVKATVPWTFAIPPAAGVVAYLAARLIL